jgi:hypothetical protein
MLLAKAHPVVESSLDIAGAGWPRDGDMETGGEGVVSEDVKVRHDDGSWESRDWREYLGTFGGPSLDTWSPSLAPLCSCLALW